MEKGQSEIVGNVIVVLLSVGLVSAISLLVSQIYSAHLKAEIEEELNQLGRIILSEISELYDVGKKLEFSPKINESLKLVEISLNLPSRIANRNYEISFGQGQRKLILKTLQDPEVIVEMEIPKLGIEFNGKSKNGFNSSLVYYRINSNGEIKNIVSFETGEE